MIEKQPSHILEIINRFDDLVLNATPQDIRQALKVLCIKYRVEGGKI